MKTIAVAGVLLFCGAGQVVQCAEVVIGDLGPDPTFFEGQHRFVGQTFVVPDAGFPVLKEWDISIFPRNPNNGAFDFYIAHWTSGVIGATIYHTLAPWTTTSDLIQLTNLNLTLNFGETYLALYDFNGYDGMTVAMMNALLNFPPGLNYYDGGQASFGNSLSEVESNAALAGNLDTQFGATFTGSAVPADSAPEPSSALLIGIGIAVFVRLRAAISRLAS